MRAIWKMSCPSRFERQVPSSIIQRAL